MLIEVAKRNELASCGVKAIEVEGKEIVLCNFNGEIFAVDRRCGHMNAPLDLGTLEDHILTCPLHSVQFDITTGTALNRPLYHYSGKEEEETPQKSVDNFPQWVSLLYSHIKICNIKTYPVRTESDSIKILI